jgi:Fe2+ or Zn2+ uptake regulation protein
MANDFIEMLRTNDLQVTAQRLAVLRAVTEHPHGTANEIAEDVRRTIGTISRQSVYDTLTLLTEHEIVRRIQPAGLSARYEDRIGDNHHHLVCRICDRLIDVDCAVGEVPCLIPVDSGDFLVDEAEVTYWGICPACQTHRSTRQPEEQR